LTDVPFSSSLLDPALLARLAAWEFHTRGITEGTLAGRHRSRRRGRALEFSGHRPFTPSDDPRSVDWRAYARTDRWVIREEEEESNRRVFLLLDASASMGYQGGGKLSKGRYAATLLAALAYTLIRQGEAVGAGLFSENLGRVLPPKVGLGQLSPLLDLLDKAVPSGSTRLDLALESAGGLLPRRCWIILASDFWGPADPHPAIKRLLSRGHEVSVLLPLDPWELSLPPSDDALFQDLETASTLRVSVPEIRDGYRALAEARFSTLEKTMSALGAHAVRCSTDRPLEDGLSAFLSRCS
jgi:uncharacterized protein (DUF58 family)